MKTILKILFLSIAFSACSVCYEMPLQNVEITFENGQKDTILCRHPLGIDQHRLITISGGCSNDTQVAADSVMNFKIID